MVDCPKIAKYDYANYIRKLWLKIAGYNYTLVHDSQLFKHSPDGKNNKFYIVQVIKVDNPVDNVMNQNQVWVRYGRVFTEGFGGGATYPSVQTAHNVFNTLINKKKRKGYKERQMGGVDEAQVNLLANLESKKADQQEAKARRALQAKVARTARREEIKRQKAQFKAENKLIIKRTKDLEKARAKEAKKVAKITKKPISKAAKK